MGPHPHPPTPAAPVPLLPPQAAVIVDNMAKLVDNPVDAAVFLPRLLPGLQKMAEEISDPEARNVAEKAQATLIQVGAEGDVEALSARYKPADAAETRAHLGAALQGAGAADAAVLAAVLVVVALIMPPALGRSGPSVSTDRNRWGALHLLARGGLGPFCDLTDALQQRGG